jgi:riboflavin kinase/FMN adenylyltransferase
MRVYRDYLAPVQPCAAVALGAFDGVHRGHQALVAQAQQCAAAEGRTDQVAVVCFEPLPRQYFGRSGPVARLSMPAERARLLTQLSVRQCWQLRFNAALANTEAEAFVQQVLVDSLQVQHVVVGGDFRFGARRKGDVALLQQLGKQHGFSVHVVNAVLHQGERISSSRIRQALAEGELSLAEELLGRPFCISGRVRHGKKLGRTLGYPTANIALPRRIIPVEGVFAVRAQVLSPSQRSVKRGVLDESTDKQGLERLWIDGVASLGCRPTVNSGEPLLEVHLFDFQQDLYGQHLKVWLVHKLRDEAHFPTVDAMVAQIHDDAKQARLLLQQG